MSLLCLKTCFAFFPKRAKKCNLLVDLSGFFHWAYGEPTYPAFWLYQVCESNGKLSNIVHLIALPSPLQFDEGQIQLVYAFRCLRWLVLRVQAIYFQIPIPRSDFLKPSLYCSFFYRVISKWFADIPCCLCCVVFQFEFAKKSIRMWLKSMLCQTLILPVTTSTLMIPC